MFFYDENSCCWVTICPHSFHLSYQKWFPLVFVPLCCRTCLDHCYERATLLSQFVVAPLTNGSLTLGEQNKENWQESNSHRFTYEDFPMWKWVFENYYLLLIIFWWYHSSIIKFNSYSVVMTVSGRVSRLLLIQHELFLISVCWAV